MANHYVDNTKFCEALIEYRAAVAHALTHNLERPRVPEYVGACILMIANRLATKPSFANYSYREDMVADGVENCICYIDNFDPAKSTNPFAYFTQIIYFAFLKRLQKEKKQLYVKHKTSENASIFHTTYTESEDGDSGGDIAMIAAGQQFDDSTTHSFIRSFEDDLQKKKDKRKKGIEDKLLDLESE